MTENNKIIGIDLGTTNSVLAVVREGTAEVLPVQGARLLPSVVGIGAADEVLVGTPARNQWVVAPDRTIRSIKRKMGSTEAVMMAGREYRPQEISAFILRTLKQAAEQALGHAVERAVITVPAYFNEVQRQATIEAGEIAGLRVERIINEPTAAALSYGYGLDSDAHLRILVYDLGGGTFDVSIIELNFGVVEVLATAGDNMLGGDDFDEALAGLLADQFAAEHKIDLRENHQAWARLLRAAEEAKIDLSSQPFVNINLEYLAKDKKGRDLHIEREIKRHQFIDLIGSFLERTLACIDQALADAKLTAEDIDRVLLVGGSTRIPAVWEQVAQRLQQDPHAEIDPDEAVALGAAVQAGIIAGEEIDAILVDVTPLSLGIETARFGVTGQIRDDQFARIVQRNATIPVQKSEIFYTLYPGQDTIRVRVYQGEHSLASRNTLLGDFLVEDLKPTRPGGVAEVTVNFQLDVNGILHVTVTDRATGKQVREQLKADRKRLSPEQIAESQAKLAADYEAAAPVVLDPGVAALIKRAQTALDNPDLDADLAVDLQATVDEILQAEENGDGEEVEKLSDELIDLLFEAEE